MRQICTYLIVAFATLASSVPVWAADEKPGRYTMTPTESGALKLDTLTGVVSQCTRADGDWSCKPTKDGEQTLRREIEGMKSEVEVLKDQLTKMEEMAGIGDPKKSDGPLSGPRPQDKMDLPSEKDVDQAFDYFEGMVKKLRERFRKLDNEDKKGAPL
jgi:polyhydroxyalkanoate synthesis regulator phasin